MDWITQNTFRNWLLVVLVVSNLLTVSIIWMQTAKTNEPQQNEPGPRSSESVNLLKRVLDLDEAQAKRVESTLASGREQSKQYDDRLAELKRRLAEELFKDNPDTSVAHATAKEIGELQAKVEMIRYSHFQELLGICTPGQREKLKPIVIQVFGRRPPQEESGETKPPPPGGREERKPREDKIDDTQGERPQPPREREGGPPSIDDKLARYTESLHLSDEQAQKIRAVLLNAKRKGEHLRMTGNPDQDYIRGEQEKIVKEEDESIMSLLIDDQKKEFQRLLSKRRK